MRSKAYYKTESGTLEIGHVYEAGGIMHTASGIPIESDGEVFVELKGWPDRWVQSYNGGRVYVVKKKYVRPSPRS